MPETPAPVPTMSAEEQAMHRDRIRQELRITNRPLEVDDIEHWCSVYPNDPYCVFWRARNASQRDTRDWIADQLNIWPRERMTDADVRQFCERRRNIAFDPAAGYCHYVLNRDSYDRTSIERSMGIPTGTLTEEQARRWCQDHPEDGYCQRHGLAAPPTLSPGVAVAPREVRAAQVQRSRLLKTGAVVGGSLLAGVLLWSIARKI